MSLVRFDASIVRVKQSFIVSQIVSSPVVLSLSLSEETSVTVNNSPIQDYVHPDDQTQPTFAFFKFSIFSSLLVCRRFGYQQWLFSHYRRIIHVQNLSKLTGKQMDKVRRIVHLKLRPFHFQIKTYYLSDANYPTDNPSQTDNLSLV